MNERLYNKNTTSESVREFINLKYCLIKIENVDTFLYYIS